MHGALSCCRARKFAQHLTVLCAKKARICARLLDALVSPSQSSIPEALGESGEDFKTAMLSIGSGRLSCCPGVAMARSQSALRSIHHECDASGLSAATSCYERRSGGNRAFFLVESRRITQREVRKGAIAWAEGAFLRPHDFADNNSG